MFKVYVVSSRDYYGGVSLVAAGSAEEANDHIRKFRERDVDNEMNSNGYDFVEEYDAVGGVYSETEGIVHYGIYYRG